MSYLMLQICCREKLLSSVLAECRPEGREHSRTKLSASDLLQSLELQLRSPCELRPVLAVTTSGCLPTTQLRLWSWALLGCLVSGLVVANTGGLFSL